ncbi:MAG TPA: hypothetical protein VLT86_10830 [Vicinamibacterales bacterium]|nr:hypothetical protein [Vicinamibacterales bacterium]
MTTSLADKGAKYRIHVQGRLEPQWAARLGDLTLAVHDRGGASAVTALTGWISDQAALMGVLEQLYALGVTLLSVERVEEDTETSRHA